MLPRLSQTTILGNVEMAVGRGFDSRSGDFMVRMINRIETLYPKLEPVPATSHGSCPFCGGNVIEGPLRNGALFCEPDCGAWCCPGPDGTNGEWVQERAMEE